jgi:hypothetical protein
MKIHLKTLEKTKGKEMAGSSIEFMMSSGPTNRRANKKKNK